MLVAATGAGVLLVEDDRAIDLGGPVRAISSDERMWAVVGDHDVLASSDGVEWERAGSITDLSIRCVLGRGEEAFAGTSEAHLYAVRGGAAKRIESFEQVEGRETWHTPWGGPPDTRSLAAAPGGAVYANVHVGGIPKTSDGGQTWAPTIDVDADVHQVICKEDLIFAACAPGLAVSADEGATWRIDSDGLHGSYCRSVAVAGDTLLVGASTGPFTKQAAVYRRPLLSNAEFVRCAGGLPDWFGSNVDTHLLAAAGDRAAIGTDEGDVWISEDRGETWSLAAKGLPNLSGFVWTDAR